MITPERGLIVELDYAVPGGPEFLFETLQNMLASIDPGLRPTPLDEARYFAGRKCEAALAAYFAVRKCKKTAPKAARDLAAAVRTAFTAKLPSLLAQSVRNFVKAMSADGVKMLLVTNADTWDQSFLGSMAPILVGDNASIVHEDMTLYGGVSGEAIRRLVNQIHVHHSRLVFVAGSAVSVKECLKHGIGSVAVSCRHNEYQDYSGVSAMVDSLGAQAVKKIKGILRI